MITSTDCINRYGPIQAAPEGGLLWRAAPDWIIPVQVPDEIVLRNYLKKPVYRIFCNKDMATNLLKAFDLLIASGCHMELETFDGCFSVRWIRGMPGAASLHSWGVAIDFNAHKNPLGKNIGSWSKDFLECFDQAGFTNGGVFTRKDFMHFQLKELPK